MVLCTFVRYKSSNFGEKFVDNKYILVFAFNNIYLIIS